MKQSNNPPSYTQINYQYMEHVIHRCVSFTIFDIDININEWETDLMRKRLQMDPQVFSPKLRKKFEIVSVLEETL